MAMGTETTGTRADFVYLPQFQTEPLNATEFAARLAEMERRRLNAEDDK